MRGPKACLGNEGAKVTLPELFPVCIECSYASSGVYCNYHKPTISAYTPSLSFVPPFVQLLLTERWLQLVTHIYILIRNKLKM